MELGKQRVKLEPFIIDTVKIKLSGLGAVTKLTVSQDVNKKQTTGKEKGKLARG